ncbi:hypothetical protein CAPTEDRAFT_190117 [Capitella teleta]|uniref:CARD domain-containing protein n=1 Tax=Capitella teleta TaxID=283909 RepID=R7UTF3_CAPTE|nr:hypothetical protein CAPTEDRAFT_190117 [Capitella teleta]|eukprot:ELU07197.1 hypothetical protein CAPTEDRAFT_190117 [Capitella teleta]
MSTYDEEDEVEERWSEMTPHFQVLSHTLEPPKFMANLMAKKVLSIDDFQQIEGKSSRQDVQIMYLIDMVKRRGRNGYDAFLQVIEFTYPETFTKITKRKPRDHPPPDFICIYNPPSPGVTYDSTPLMKTVIDNLTKDKENLEKKNQQSEEQISRLRTENHELEIKRLEAEKRLREETVSKDMLIQKNNKLEIELRISKTQVAASKDSVAKCEELKRENAELRSSLEAEENFRTENATLKRLVEGLTSEKRTLLEEIEQMEIQANTNNARLTRTEDLVKEEKARNRKLTIRLNREITPPEERTMKRSDLINHICTQKILHSEPTSVVDRYRCLFTSSLQKKREEIPKKHTLLLKITPEAVLALHQCKMDPVVINVVFGEIRNMPDRLQVMQEVPSTLNPAISIPHKMQILHIDDKSESYRERLVGRVVTGITRHIRDIQGSQNT